MNQCRSPMLALDMISLSELLQVLHVYPDSIHREPWGSLVFGGRPWWKEWARCQACYGCERFATCHFGFSRKLDFSSWSFLCFKAKYVLGWVLCLFAWYIRPLGGGGGSQTLQESANLMGEGGGRGGVSCFYSFGEPLKTWTYAMLTCIVYHVILLYSWTSQTCVHDNVWLKT